MDVEASDCEPSCPEEETDSDRRFRFGGRLDSPVSGVKVRSGIGAGGVNCGDAAGVIVLGSMYGGWMASA